MAKVMLPLKPYRQTRGYLCGPASLRIVFRYYGVDVAEKMLAKVCGSSKTLGTSARGIKKGAEYLGFKAIIKDDSNLKDIEQWLNKKTPVIVDWFTRGRRDYSDSDIAEGHYSVVAGLDDEYIYLQDPELGEIRKMSRQNFKQVWFDWRGFYIKPQALAIRRMIAVYK
ncbi:hypothetical protein COU01_02405 [Candidatus Falkowbacteria bacterium CG10_big_fil_rev_8_21_14_0_10_44_15]|uniref:Peptidase C39 domain-containing protein n=1 Tax=Candidatus Falkowbacteria bacterium CG10_big_fil_rev_8_21_14_0_10_44_15 TaxID=1974569 RepID=A0A2H0UZM8_9BACT|nr:MAG: hypothetical protein COU01_02405 [Candidatus Falkowbacteria bacterium CG10_big_fil_rev_8_21_14_0_10_44_15]